MIFRRFGSPALPVLGALLMFFAAALSFWQLMPTFGAPYIRWQDLAFALRSATVFVAFGVAIVSSYNVAAFTAPKMITATPLGKRPLLLQVIHLILAAALLAIAGLLVGLLPAYLVAAVRTDTVPLSFYLTVFSAASLLVCISSVGGLVGVVSKRLHPAISCIIALLITYVVVVFSANETTLWALLPTNINPALSYVVFTEENLVITAGGVFLLALLTLALVIGSLSRHAEAQTTRAAIVTAGVIGIFAASGTVQAAAGPISRFDNDVCQFSSAGTEICVDAADLPALEDAIVGVEAFEAYVPQITPTRIAEHRSFRMQEAAYQPLNIVEPQKRADLTPYILDMLRLSSCPDPLAEGAKVIDRVGTRIVQETGMYSKSVENYGAFYLNLDEGGNHHVPDDILSPVSEQAFRQTLTQNWDTITSCQGSFAMFGLQKMS